MQWKYRGKNIAEFNSKVVYSPGSQFDGRLEMNVINFSLTIRKLTLQDSGEFLVVAETDMQIPTKAVTLQVHAGALILDSPAYPMSEGDSVTLRCTNRYQETNLNPRVDFYKDGVLIRNETTGEMTIPAVSKSDEGSYKCKSNEGESPESWVTVRGSIVSISVLPRLLCGLLVASPFLLVSIVLMVKCCRARGLCSTAKSPQDELPSDDVIKQTESSV
ncbi:sialoadhesin-like [Salvelinus namaycush]|uniref:Sialoadhesin-like n=1 Tax=Salvelinus namaycush TaxID=8040 RepID=A0A8U0QZH3_SALNM|nr:sialoadhesin-like [Salvelinus namaycush]